jgi:AcrR family transcriptional regulator
VSSYACAPDGPRSSWHQLEVSIIVSRTTSGRAHARAAERKSAYHHGDLRRALVVAARAILEEDSLAALSLRAVARRAGVSQAAPYHHFPDKDALLAAVAADGFDALDQAMQARMAGVSDPAERLIASGVAYVMFAVASPALFQIMFGAAMHGLAAHAERIEAGKRAYATLEQAVTAMTEQVGGAEADVAFACLGAWAVAHGLAKLLVEGGLDPTRYGVAGAEELVQLALRRMRVSLTAGTG